MPQTLTASQKRHLRGLAHALKPVIQIGAKGVTPALLAELEQALEHHELLKVKLAAENREACDALVDELSQSVDAALVQRIGHTVVLFRRNREQPQIILPR